MSTTTLYPLSWFPSLESSRSPGFDWTTICLAAGVSPSDEEVAATYVDRGEALAAFDAAGKTVALTDGVFGEDEFVLVTEVGQDHGRLLRVTKHGAAWDAVDICRV